MKPRKFILVGFFLLLAIAALAYANRFYFLQYSLGIYNAIAYPRDEAHPVSWEQGPTRPDKPLSERPPNIIVILADDLGMNDVTTYGAGRSAQGVSTPGIDAIAREGVRFERGYAGAPICTVSRAALLTGRYPWRFGLEFTPTPGAMAKVAGELFGNERALRPLILNKDSAAKAVPFDDQGMPPSEQTLAELLKPRGYHTMHIGKWHLGQSTAMRPNNQGFDESLNMEGLLYLDQNDPGVVNAKQDFDKVSKFLWDNGRASVSFNGGKQFKLPKYMTDYYTDEALKAIRSNKNRPFLLYLAHWGPHTPLQASRQDYDDLANIPDHSRRVYSAMVRAVDRSVSRVLKTLQEEGLDDNTIVIFASDNGAPAYIGLPEVNQPYRGWKLTMFEGGLRVPYVAKWPGRIPAGSRYAAPISNIDVLPTLLAAAGAALPKDRVIDGVNLLPFIAGTKTETQPPRALFWRDGPYRAVQEQGWKLIVSERPKKNWLFDLNRDPTEQTNLAERDLQKLAYLQKLLLSHHADMPPPLWPSFLELPVEIDKTMNQKQLPDDEYTYWNN